MILFIKVFFWFGLVGCVLRLLLIGFRKYPVTTTKTLGSDLAGFIELAIFVAWAGMLVWGGK